MDVIKHITDLEVMAQISAENRDTYRTSLEVMTIYPDYALTTFRKLLELMVTLVGDKLHLPFGDQDLCWRINHLHECQLLSHATKSDCHSIRLWGNQAVHASPQELTAKDENDKVSPQSGDVDQARRARKLFTSVLCEFHSMLFGKTPKLIIIPAEVPDLVPGQAVGKAIASEDSFEAKMQAGLVLEAEWLSACGRGGLISTRISAIHATLLKTMAVEMYRCACEISARLDVLSLAYIHTHGGSEALWLQRADTEALFRFGSLAYTVEPATDIERLATAALKEAATRKHPQASVYCGDHLRQIGEFGQAEQMLTFAATSEQSKAYLGLYFLYSATESPCYSPERAVGILEQGVSRDDADCKFQLGVVLNDGELVDQDKTRARLLLTEAAEQGIKRAAAYLNLVVDDTFQKHFQMMGVRMLAGLSAEREQYKSLDIGRNDLCPCSSGQKYKKCHGR
ncbi:SEC-C metal-binding domain-containing protein [Pseudomonas sp. NA-150]|uniref:SEC-C metal-binding domain-containing protein n=1 Tax=Pseudomonas sp. NA-150 TaxID=3367525 RepID=UPI0037CABCD3